MKYARGSRLNNMVLFTKDAFIQLKYLTCLNVNAVAGPVYPGATLIPPPSWQIFIMGITPDLSGGNGGGYDQQFQLNIQCESKEEAHRVYNDLVKQIADSGEIPKMNDKLLDDVLKGEDK